MMNTRHVLFGALLFGRLWAPLKNNKSVWLIPCALLLLLQATAYAQIPADWLDQGWTPAQREAFYSTPQGSYLIPKDWFLALERQDKRQLFADPKNIARYGYLLKNEDLGGSAAIPLGFAVESRPDAQDWIGYTCAGCHTNDITYGESRLRLDGAPALASFDLFYRELAQAAYDTVHNEKKFYRFADRVLINPDASGYADLHLDLSNWVEQAQQFITRNTKPHAYGYGRLDAFGIIMNELFAKDLGVAENRGSPNAPVSYPFLWGTPAQDFVQWNGSANNPLGRNIGEVLGAFGAVELQDLSQLGKTTARAQQLIELEKLVALLRAPIWPQAVLGTIDQQRVERGRALYQASQQEQPACVSCHALPGEEGNYPLTPAEENLFGVQFVKTQIVPLKQIGTDPLSATNFATRKVSTAHLSAYLPAPYTGAAELPAPALLGITVGLAVADGLSNIIPALTDAELADAIGYRRAAVGYPPYAPPNLLAYRARSLEGIWATAPYLHNGSVQNLYQLLLPAAQRKQQFYVGSRAFDPYHVGFRDHPKKSAEICEVTLLDTSLPGNSNQGHEYGTWMTHQQRLDLIEFLKTL